MMAIYFLELYGELSVQFSAQQALNRANGEPISLRCVCDTAERF